MKTLYYLAFISGLSLLLSCKSVDKLVDQGRYDEAIVLATKKLSNQKNKKTKHVKALEKAFTKVNQYDLRHIEALKYRNDPTRWDEIYDYLDKIERRQRVILPLLPIVSKDGYDGYFELIETAPRLAEAAEEASKYRYDAGSELLQKSRESKDKLQAQDAYYILKGISRFYRDFRNTNELLRESRILGTFFVLVQRDDLYDHVAYHDRNVNFSKNAHWTEYHFSQVEGILYDAITNLYIDIVEVSPQNESVNTIVENKEVERWVDAIDREGNLVVDSLGNVIQVKQTDRYSAYITEIIRSKSALITARLVIKDFETGNIIFNDDLRHEVLFESDGCTFSGDREALPGNVVKRLDHNLLPFPADRDMIVEGLEIINKRFMKIVGKVRLSSDYGQLMASTW